MKTGVRVRHELDGVERRGVVERGPSYGSSVFIPVTFEETEDLPARTVWLRPAVLEEDTGGDQNEVG